jgi:hypothetical protein
VGIYESAIFQGKTPQDSQAIWFYLNNPNLARHRSCHITQIAKVLMSERNLNF